MEYEVAAAIADSNEFTYALLGLEQLLTCLPLLRCELVLCVLETRVQAGS